MILLYLKPNQRPGEEAGARPISASFCVGSVPSSKILVNNKEVYSNLLLENNFVNSYNQHTYLLNDLILTRSNKSSATTDNPSIHDSYICQDEVTHYSSNPTYYQKILAEKTMWSFVELDEDRPAYLELPKPILLNTNGGAVVRFYDSANSNTSCYEHPCTGKAVSLIYNLIPSKTYYYKVYNSGNAIVTLGSFTTQGSIRMIRMDGIRNMRDCGGYTTKDGNSRLKYGLLFRGSQCLPTYYNTTSGEYNCTKLRRKLDGDPSSDNIMIGGATLRDVNEFKKLNVGKDIDLRDAGGDYIVTGSDLKINRCVPFFDPTTDGITYWAASTSISSNPAIPPYGALFGNDTTNTTTISTRKTLFKNFLTLVYDTVSSGKAVYVHCLQGKDRTGTFMAALFALLGIKDDGIIKDYELTSLWAVGLTTRYNFLYGTSNSGKDKSYLTFNTTGSLEDYVKNWLGVTSGSENETLINNLKSVLLESISSETTPEEPEIEPDVEPEVEEVLFLHPGRYSISSVTDNEFRRFNYKANDYDLWAHILIPVSLGDVVKLTYSCTTGFPIYFILHNSDTLFNSVRTSTSNLTPTVVASRCLWHASDSEGDFQILVATRSGVTTCTDTITVSENAKYLHIGVGCYPTDGTEGYISINDPNSEQQHKATVKIYKNDTLIFG